MTDELLHLQAYLIANEYGLASLLACARGTLKPLTKGVSTLQEAPLFLAGELKIIRKKTLESSWPYYDLMGNFS